MKTFAYIVGLFAVVSLVLLGVDRVTRVFVPDEQPVIHENATTTAPTNTHSTPEVTFSVPEGYGLAVRQEQVLATSYIPPCDPDFDYCIYHYNDEYAGTNFDSAGLRIERRADLAAAGSCLTAQPSGYEGLVPETMHHNAYDTAVFGPVGDAGAGHSASGNMYRLRTATTCFEFQTRIGMSQFQNYEPGTIEEFTQADRDAVEAQLLQVLNSMTLQDGTPITF
jgi:hypothetical protein